MRNVSGAPEDQGSLSYEQRLAAEQALGTGLTAEVFPWGTGRVLKLFFRWVATETIERELAITQAVSALGAPVPAAFEMLRAGERSGIVFERISGRSLVNEVEAKPWMLFRAARRLAELHAQVHGFAAPAVLPTQHDQIERWISEAEDFTDSQKQLAREHLARLPCGQALCHGDFHPGNILLSPRGPVIIDWAGATRGHPLADVARTSVLFERAQLPRSTAWHVRVMMKLARRLLHGIYLPRYFAVRGGTVEEIEFWRVAQRLAGSAWRAGRRAALAGVGLPDLP